MVATLGELNQIPARTRRKLEYHCGSIEAVLENPSMLNEIQGDPNIG